MIPMNQAICLTLRGVGGDKTTPASGRDGKARRPDQRVTVTIQVPDSEVLP